MEKIVLVVPFAYEPLDLLRDFFKKKQMFLEKHNEVFMIFVNDKAMFDKSRDAIFYEIFGYNNTNAILLANNKKMSIKAGAVYTGLGYALENYTNIKKIGFVDVDNSIDIFSLISQC